jgi:hypothetical protein
MQVAVAVALVLRGLMVRAVQAVAVRAVTPLLLEQPIPEVGVGVAEKMTASVHLAAQAS